MSGPDHLPERIGKFTILGLLGEGGIGTVYRAEQEEPVRRTVALKVLSESQASDEILARFAAERQALAVMDHPSIAKVFDAGSTEDGRPYFVMEVVEGSDLVEYSDSRRLTLRERVALFGDVCRAVQHAHQKGVIHRDLKPSNVLVSEVDGRPVPRVIDFGIAKAVEAEGFDGAGLTRDDQVIGTPAYMSPEQVLRSADVDTRSDVFSLGVLLYELLVGALPFELESYRTWGSVVANLYGTPPPTLGRRLTDLGDARAEVALNRGSSPQQLKRDLEGDLEWIVARAMEMEKGDRYETANGLALDLERFLADEPVRARGAGTVYLARKFVRRHKVAVGFGTILAMGLLGFVAVMAVQNDRISRARDEAEARRSQAEGLIDFMLGDLRSNLEPIGRLDILAGVGAQAVEYFSSLPEELFTDDELQNRSQALYQMGSVRLEQGDSQEARVAFEESLRLAKALADREPDNEERLFGLSQSHFYVGYAEWLSGAFEAAEDEFQSYLAVAEELVARDPGNPDYRMEVGYAHSNIGSVREARGDLDGAAESYLRTLEVKDDLVKRDSTNISWLGELAEEHNKLAVIYRKQGRYAEARNEHAREMDLKRRALRIDPTHAYWTRRLAWAHYYVGWAEWNLGNPDSAMRNYQMALATVRPLVERDSSNLTLRRSQAFFRTEMAAALSHQGRNEEGLAMIEDAIADLEDQLVQDPTRNSFRNTLASAHRGHALIRIRLQQPQAAVQAAEEAASLLDQEDPNDQAALARLASTFLVMGHALDAAGRETEAVASWEESLAILKDLVPGPGGEEDRPALAEALLTLDRIAEAAGEMEILRTQGYREPRLWALSREKGVVF